MPEAVNDLATAMTIRELTGDQRTIRLTGRSLPHRPFELSGSQRHSLDWYPGSPIGTLQVFGAKEEGSTFRGRWCDKFLGGDIPFGSSTTLTGSTTEFLEGVEVVVVNEERVRTARDLVFVVDDVRRKGQEVEVTWLNQVRRGLLERFTQRWQTGHDVEWELGFVWSSQGETNLEIPFEDPSTDVFDVPKAIQDRVDEMGLDAALAVPQAGDRYAFFIGQLNEQVAAIEDLADEIRDAAVQTVRNVSAPWEGLQRLAGALGGMKEAAEDARTVLERDADAAALNVNWPFGNPYGGAASRTFGQILGQRTQVREQAGAADRLRGTSASQQARLLKQINPELAAAFQARADQDLRDVSTHYYGTPDEWRSLMLFNRLTSSALRAGQVVFVPARPPRSQVTV